MKEVGCLCPGNSIAAVIITIKGKKVGKGVVVFYPREVTEHDLIGNAHTYSSKMKENKRSNDKGKKK